MPGMKRDCGGAAAILGAFRATVKQVSWAFNLFNALLHFFIPHLILTVCSVHTRDLRTTFTQCSAWLKTQSGPSPRDPMIFTLSTLESKSFCSQPVLNMWYESWASVSLHDTLSAVMFVLSDSWERLRMKDCGDKQHWCWRQAGSGRRSGVRHQRPVSWHHSGHGHSDRRSGAWAPAIC